MLVLIHETFRQWLLCVPEGFFFGEAKKSEIAKKPFFIAFSSSPKKTSDTQGRQWPIYSLFFCLKRRATGKIGPIFVFTICFRYSFIRLTNRHAKTSLYTYKEGDSGGGKLRNPSPSPFFLAQIPFPFNACHVGTGSRGVSCE